MMILVVKRGSSRGVDGNVTGK